MSPIKAAVLAIAILLSPSLAQTPALAQTAAPEDDLLRAVEVRAGGTSFAELDACLAAPVQGISVVVARIDRRHRAELTTRINSLPNT